jgi:uncharacterized repeat protein (TIGR02543 family)
MARAYIGSARINKIYAETTKIKRIYDCDTLVWSCMHNVTYHIDTNTTQVVEIADEADAIAGGPTPTLAGYTFVGWRTDTTASPSVISSKSITEDGVELYAVFKKTITVSLLGGSSAVYNTGTQYYNNGNYANPSITLGTSAIAGWSLYGYRTDKTATTSVTYLANHAYTFSQNTTLYAAFGRTITVALAGGSVAVYNTGTQLYNNGNWVHPYIKLGTSAIAGWALIGYRGDTAATPSVTYVANGTYQFSDNVTLYAVFQRTLTLSYNGNGATSGGLTAQTGTQYYNNGNWANPSFTLQSSNFVRRSTASASGVTGIQNCFPITLYFYSGWGVNNASSVTHYAGNVVTIGDNATVYAIWDATSYNYNNYSNMVRVQSFGYSVNLNTRRDHSLYVITSQNNHTAPNLEFFNNNRTTKISAYEIASAGGGNYANNSGRIYEVWHGDNSGGYYVQQNQTNSQDIGYIYEKI